MLLLPEKEDNNITPKEPVTEKIDVESPHASGASVNVSESVANFSPITFRNWISKSPGNGSPARRSSLVRSTESNDYSLQSTPKSSRGTFRKDEKYLLKKGEEFEIGRAHV